MKNSAIAALLIGLILLAGCGPEPGQPQESPDRTGLLSIAVTFYPLQEAVMMVTGDSAEVFSIVPPFSEPHGYEPSPQDILAFNKADVFVTMGFEFENLEQDLINSAENVIIINSAEGIALIDAEEYGREEEKHENEDDDNKEEEHENEDNDGEEEKHENEDDDNKEEEHENEDNDGEEEKHENEDDDNKEEEHDEEQGHGKDPHFWLSPENVKQMVRNVKDGLVKADPQNAALYERNALQSIDRLSALDQEFRTGLASCARDTVLVSHNAFSYLGRDYGFEVIGLSGLSPEAEPTPQQIKKLVDEAKERKLKYVFYETLVDPRVSSAIASEVGAQLLELNPLEGAKDGEVTYFSLMRKNLANLRTAMECS